MSTRVIVPYEHKSGEQIRLGISIGGQPPTVWRPALKDTINGRQVAWAVFDIGGPVPHAWIRYPSGQVRLVTTISRRGG